MPPKHSVWATFLLTAGARRFSDYAVLPPFFGYEVGTFQALFDRKQGLLDPFSSHFLVNIIRKRPFDWRLQTAIFRRFPPGKAPKNPPRCRRYELLLAYVTISAHASLSSDRSGDSPRAYGISAHQQHGSPDHFPLAGRLGRPGEGL